MIQLALQGTILWGVPTSFITAFIFNIILVAVAVLLSFGISKKIGGKLRCLSASQSLILLLYRCSAFLFHSR